MSITSSEKIFVDPKDEITFVLDRIFSAQKERIILVIPQNSLLLSSIVSLGILYREVVESKSIVLIVTEDEYGTTIAQKVGFIAVKKVSQISPELWDIAYNRKLKDLEFYKKNKDERIAENSESLSQTEDVREEKSPAEEYVSETVENKEAVIEQNFKEQITESEVDVVPVEQENVKNTEEDLKPYHRKSLQPKIVNLDGIEILAGDDIAYLEGRSESDRITNFNKQNVMEVPQRSVEKVSNTNFIGKDFTKQVNSNKGLFSGLFSNPFKKKTVSIGQVENFDHMNFGVASAKKRRRRVFYISIASVAFFTLVAVCLIVFQWSSVDIILTVESKDVSSSSEIIVDPAVEESDFTGEKIIIPGKVVEATDVNLSRTGEASGQGRSGNKAKGLVNIYNKTQTELVIANGAIITNVSTNLNYIITKDLVIPAAEEIGGVIDANNAKAEDVTIEAADIGAEYNLDSATEGLVFLLEGYTSSQVGVSRFNPVSGGTTVEFTIVSEENINTLKEKSKPELETQAKKRLEALVPAGYRLVEESIEYKDETVKSFPELNQESKDKTFNLTLSVTATALTISKQDVDSAVEEIIGRDPGSSNFEVEKVEEYKINSYQKADLVYVLELSLSGSIKAKLTDDEIKQSIAGKSIGDAKAFLLQLEDVTSSRVIYAPVLVPEFLQRIPADYGRITITKK